MWNLKVRKRARFWHCWVEMFSMSARKITKNPLPVGRMRQSDSATSRLLILDPQVRLCASSRFKIMLQYHKRAQ